MGNMHLLYTCTKVHIHPGMDCLCYADTRYIRVINSITHMNSVHSLIAEVSFFNSDTHSEHLGVPIQTSTTHYYVHITQHVYEFKISVR